MYNRNVSGNFGFYEKGQVNFYMEETIRTESGTAGQLFSMQTVEGFLAILLGTALIISLVFPGTPKGLTEEAQFRNADIIGGRITAGNPAGKQGTMDGLILKRLLEEQPVSELCLTESVMPEQALVLPDMSDGNVWDAVQASMAEAGHVKEETDRDALEKGTTRAVSENLPWDAEEGRVLDQGIAEGLLAKDQTGDTGVCIPMLPDIVKTESGIQDVTYEDPNTGKPAVPGNPSEGGVLAEPSVPGNLSGAGSGRPANPSVPGSFWGTGSGAVEESSVPGNSSGTGSGTVMEPSVPGNFGGTGSGVVAEPIVPENPSGAGNAVNPAEPEEPIGGGVAVDPAEPGNPFGGGTVIEPTVPENPSEGGAIVDPAEPEEPIGGGTVEPTVPENPSGGGTAADPSVPDTEEGENGEQPSVSCFLLDEMGMLYGFLPEYAEIPDGCLTLPAECTGIRRGAFSGCGAGILELYIPVGAVTIEEGALADLVSLEWIEVESGNSGCVSDSGVLFDSTMSVLLAFPAAWMDVYSVPSYVTRIADRAFDGTSIYRLDLRECGILSFGENVFGRSGGSGIEVAVREPELAQYAGILSGYAVTLTK